MAITKAVITQDFPCSGRPDWATANKDVLALDIATGIRYQQKTIPYGNNWAVESTNNIYSPSAGVQSVTGLDTDNTDPLNPIIEIAVDGVTITGDGTPGLPLTAIPPTGFVESVTADGGGVVTVDNTDPLNPIVEFQGVNVDGNTITGTGTAGDPLKAHSAGGANLWAYKAKTTITSGDPGAGYMIWDNATQISAGQINLSHLTDGGFDFDLFFPFIVTGDTLIVQDRDNSNNNQIWTVSGTPLINPNLCIEIPVTLTSSGGTGTTNFANNHELIVAKFAVPPSVITIPQLMAYIHSQ